MLNAEQQQFTALALMHFAVRQARRAPTARFMPQAEEIARALGIDDKTIAFAKRQAFSYADTYR